MAQDNLSPGQSAAPMVIQMQCSKHFEIPAERGVGAVAGQEEEKKSQ